MGTTHIKALIDKKDQETHPEDITASEVEFKNGVTKRFLDMGIPVNEHVTSGEVLLDVRNLIANILDEQQKTNKEILNLLKQMMGC